MQIILFVQQSHWKLKITLPSKINSFVGIYNSQIRLHIPLKKVVNASYKHFRAKRSSDKKLVLCWRFIHFIHVNGDARWTPGSRFRCTPQSNPAKILQLLMDGQSSFDLANGSTFWISVFISYFLSDELCGIFQIPHLVFIG